MIESFSQDYYWRTKSGQSINIRDMEDIHIKRCINKLKNTNSDWIEIFQNELNRRKNEIKVQLNNNKSPVYVSVGLSRIPKNCGECPLWLNNEYYDEHPTWGDGVSNWCPFNADYFGCLVERPKNCPLVVR